MSNQNNNNQEPASVHLSHIFQSIAIIILWFVGLTALFASVGLFFWNKVFAGVNPYMVATWGQAFALTSLGMVVAIAWNTIRLFSNQVFTNWLLNLLATEAIKKLYTLGPLATGNLNGTTKFEITQTSLNEEESENLTRILQDLEKNKSEKSDDKKTLND